jgi:hypothetical protein
VQWVGVGNQAKQHPIYTADGAVVAGGTPQLVLPVTPSRSFLMLQNLSAGSLYFEFGSARATAALTSGVISSITVTNAGFNFTKPPVVRFAGGGNSGNTSFLGLNQPGGDSPNSSITAGRVARAHCVMTGTAPNLFVSSIVIDDGGAGYVIAPYVFIFNSDLDPYGCAAPSATSGLLMATGAAPLILNGSSCPTDSISVYGGTTAWAYLCRWMT